MGVWIKVVIITRIEYMGRKISFWWLIGFRGGGGSVWLVFFFVLSRYIVFVVC